MPPLKPSNPFTRKDSIFAWRIRGEQRWPRRFWWRVRCCSFPASARNSCRIWMRAPCGSARRCPTPFRLTNRAKIAPRMREILRSFPAGHHRRLGARPARRRHRSDGLFQRGVLRRPQAVFAVDRPLPHQAGTDRGHQQEARRSFPESSSTTPSRRKTPWTKRKRD